MKLAKYNVSGKNILSVVITALILFAFTSCARKVNFLTSSVVPAARGYVKIKKDDNQNYAIQLELSNLAEVKRLQPPNLAYIVWMESGNEAPKNLGQINSSSNGLSKKLKASFETVSASKPNRIFITAEDDASVEYPGVQIVLATDKF